MSTKPICNIDLSELLDWIAAEQDGEPELANGADILRQLERWVNDQQPVITDARCGNCGSELFMPTAALSLRLRAAAEVIEQINAMAGLGLNCAVSPVWLRREAAVLEEDQPWLDEEDQPC